MTTRHTVMGGGQQTRPNFVCSGSDKKMKIMAVSIDIGTTHTGCFFSFISGYNSKSPLHSIKAVAFKHRLRAPTVILFDEKKKFHSFGYEAESTFAELSSNNEHHNWYYFKHFKMPLHEKKITRDIEIEDAHGRKLKALDVFGAEIAYLKSKLLDSYSSYSLHKRSVCVENNDIHWVLTVPVIWTYSAKQLLREAAYKADIDGGQLSILSAPEAAILYYRLIPTSKTRGSESAETFVASCPGTKYMVIDVEDGTANITVHQIQGNGELEELHKESRCAREVPKVDDEFYKLLIRIIGGPVYTLSTDQNKLEHLDLQSALEVKKRTVTLQSSDKKINIVFPVDLSQIYLDEMKEDIQEAINGSPYSGNITLCRNVMRIDAHVFKDLFKPCTDKIVDHIKDMLKKPDIQGTNIFLMAGGFSLSPMLQDRIKKAFPNSNVMVSADPELTVLAGAVIFGHRPVVITSCVSRYTYGICISLPFDPTIHTEDHRVSVRGIDLCRDVFKKYIHKGEVVRVCEPHSGTFVTLKSDQREMLLKVFASPKLNPHYVDDDDTEYLGNVVVKLPDSKDKIRVEVKMMLCETELTVEAVEMSQYTKYRAYFEYL